MTAKFYGFERSFLHDTTEEDSWVIDMVRESEYVKLESEMAALQEQVRVLAAENSQMLRLLTDISENHDEYVGRDEYLYAGVPMDYVSEINMYVSRDVNAENPFGATDAAIREIRARAVEGYAATVGAVKNGAIYAAAIRSGEQP